MHTIAIIGSGPTGIYTAKYLLEKNIDIHITMFESQAQAGKGTPYHQDWNEQEMLANIASIEIPPIMETLVDWLKSRTDEELAALGIVREAVQDRTFFPRVTASFKPVFIDNYATVPHESIERLLALWHARKIDIIRLEKEYMLDVETSECGSILIKDGVHIHFPAFIEATGQRPLSLRDFPFPSLWKQGLLHNATIPYDAYPRSQRSKPPAYIGGIELDMTYHPVSDSPYASRLYCLSLPFILGQFPFAQGITSSHDMGKKVAHDIVLQLSTNTSIKGNNIERLKKKVI